MGALPGNADEKFNPYMLPLEDKLEELLKPSDHQRLFYEKRIDALPINYLRGANWRNKVVVADEAQNFTFKELTTLITRIGEGTKLFVCGDFMYRRTPEPSFVWSQPWGAPRLGDARKQKVHAKTQG